MKRIGSTGDEAGVRTAPVFDPASGEQTGAVVLASPGDVDRAVAGARAAWSEWRESSLSARTRMLFAFRQLADRHRDDLARLITAEHGKVLEDARGEVSRGIEVVEFACGIPNSSKGNSPRTCPAGSTLPRSASRSGWWPASPRSTSRSWSRCGCTRSPSPVAIPSSSSRPNVILPSLLIADLWRDAGLPDGVFSVVNGDAVAVNALLDHHDVAAVSFVGSTPVARQVFERATSTGKRVQALGGAKNHAVVMADADVDTTADALIAAGYGSAGERCMAISAVVAVGGGDRLVEALRVRATALKVGPGRDPGSEWGR